MDSPGLTYNAPGDTSLCHQGAALTSCDSANVEIDGEDNHPWVWRVFAAFDSASAPRLKALDFGIQYDQWNSNTQQGSLVLLDHGPCIGDLSNGGTEFPGPGWPNRSLSGQRLGGRATCRPGRCR